MFTGGHFKHKGDAQQSLLCFSVGHHLASDRENRGSGFNNKTYMNKHRLRGGENGKPVENVNIIFANIKWERNVSKIFKLDHQ